MKFGAATATMWFLWSLAASASEEPQPGAYPSSGSVPVIFSNPKWALESELQSLDYPPDAEAPGCAAPTAAKAAYPQAELPLRSWTFPDQGGSDCPWAGQTGGLALIHIGKTGGASLSAMLNAAEVNFTDVYAAHTALQHHAPRYLPSRP